MTGLELSTIAARSSGALNCPTLAPIVDNSSRNRQRRGDARKLSGFGTGKVVRWRVSAMDAVQWKLNAIFLILVLEFVWMVTKAFRLSALTAELRRRNKP